jgi:hypothetical protein
MSSTLKSPTPIQCDLCECHEAVVLALVNTGDEKRMFRVCLKCFIPGMTQFVKTIR